MTTKLTHIAFRALLLLLAGGSPQVVSAQEKGCIELATAAETEQEYVNEQGEKVKRLVSAAKVTPGDEVVWTITAKNVCRTPADNIVIANPVPEHMRYVANSAMGVGAAITYSLDGVEFGSPNELTVKEPDGSIRVARPDEYRAIRWSYPSAFAPGASAFVRYRATVK
jgi:uncharacterized repeat protein (TIGR01451 family)